MFYFLEIIVVDTWVALHSHSLRTKQAIYLDLLHVPVKSLSLPNGCLKSDGQPVFRAQYVTTLWNANKNVCVC